MSDDDELLARAEAELAAETGPSGMHYGDSTKRELYEALRAAVAAQPQPLVEFEGTFDAFVTRWDWIPGTQFRWVVYPAVAGSATPTETTPQGHTAVIRAPTFARNTPNVAGSATPSGDDSDR